MLNSGEVPNLFAADEYEQIISKMRPNAKDRGISEGDRYEVYLLHNYSDLPFDYSDYYLN